MYGSAYETWSQPHNYVRRVSCEQRRIGSNVSGTVVESSRTVVIGGDMDVINNFLGLGKTIEEAKKNGEDLVQVAMASIMGNLTNPNGLIPYAIKSFEDAIDRTINKVKKLKIVVTIE